MITLDTSSLLALLNRKDPDHEAVRTAFESDPGPYLVPAGILAEATYLVENRLGLAVLEAFLADMHDGSFSFECGEADFDRIRKLVIRYSDLPLGAADASVVACAERNGGKVLTLDLRDFNVVAGEKTISLVDLGRSL